MKKTRIPLLSLVLTICILLVQIPVSAATYDIDFETTTQAIELINLDTGTVVYQKNADQKMYPTSTTKIMTFIVASEQIPDLENTKITVTEKVVTELLGTGSSLAGVKEGEELTDVYKRQVPRDRPSLRIKKAVSPGGNSFKLSTK